MSGNQKKDNNLSPIGPDQQLIYISIMVPLHSVFLGGVFCPVGLEIILLQEGQRAAHGCVGTLISGEYQFKMTPLFLNNILFFSICQ